MNETETGNKKPCIALMGEFSAGKSTLANLLIGSDPLPVQVIATRLPPVWISYGDRVPFREDLAGDHFPVDLGNLSEVPLDETAFIKIFCREDILTQCDLLDMPGISDPNMSPEIWQRMISKATAVLWCTHATQAWRQSEAAVWAEMPPELYDRSLLLLTRMDKINSEEDRAKVVKRVQRETQGLFFECLPISLLQATHGQEDYEKWSESGAEEFAKCLSALLRKLSSELGSETSGADVDAGYHPPKILGLEGPEPIAKPTDFDPEIQTKIIPRRVSATNLGRRRVGRP